MGDVRNRGSKDCPQWYCRYRDIDGKRKHRPTHQPTKALAMRFVAEVEARVARGLVGVPEPTALERQGMALTLAGLAERFIKEANPPTKDPKRYQAFMRYMIGKHVAPAIGEVPIVLLKSGQVEALRNRKLADGYKVATINNMIKAISVLYVWARKQGLYEGINPTVGLRRTPPTGLIDYLSGDEVAKLLAYAHEHAPDVFPMIATAIYTGMRKGELFGLRWIDVLFDRGAIHVAHSYWKTPSRTSGGQCRCIERLYLSCANGSAAALLSRLSFPWSPVAVRSSEWARRTTCWTLRNCCMLRAAMFPCGRGTRCAIPSPATTSWLAATCSRSRRSSGTASSR
jgi:hypothetical protein